MTVTGSTESSSKTIVVKIGTSSLTDGSRLREAAFQALCAEIAELRNEGHRVALVSSAAISAGMAKLAIGERPRDFESLQALSAVGQVELMRRYDDTCQALGFACGQVLLAPPDFFDRARYLRARSCIEQQWVLGVLPVINENDAVADDAIRFGDNDRIAALVAHLVGADMLVLLTDTVGLLTADPRTDVDASLIEEIQVVDRELEALAGGAASTMSQGGMASKLSAARIASWSGVETVIAAAHRDQVLHDAMAGVPGSGTRVLARESSLSARKLWIAFAVRSEGRVVVDAGARDAVVARNSSLLAVGMTSVVGTFAEGSAVEIADADGSVFAKGLALGSADQMRDVIGARDVTVVHRDDLVVLPDAVV